MNTPTTSLQANSATGVTGQQLLDIHASTLSSAEAIAAMQAAGYRVNGIDTQDGDFHADTVATMRSLRKLSVDSKVTFNREVRPGTSIYVRVQHMGGRDFSLDAWVDQDKQNSSFGWEGAVQGGMSRAILGFAVVLGEALQMLEQGQDPTRVFKNFRHFKSGEEVGA